MPNGSVYPWVSAQSRLTYFNYGLRVCCTPWRIHSLGLTGEPKLSGSGEGLFLVVHADGVLCPHRAWSAKICFSPGADATRWWQHQVLCATWHALTLTQRPVLLRCDCQCGGQGAALLPGAMSAGTSNITRSLGCLWTAVMWYWLFVTVDSSEIKAGSQRLKSSVFCYEALSHLTPCYKY